jgi:hypothetical protein
LVDAGDPFLCSHVVYRGPNKNYKMEEAVCKLAVASVVPAEAVASRNLPLALPLLQDKETGIAGAGVDEEALETGLY